MIKEGAKKGKGNHMFVNNTKNITEKIINLLTSSLSPVISQIKLQYDESIVESIVPNPENLVYILKD